MENFIEFVHFLNSDKSFEFIKTKDNLNAVWDKEYDQFPYSKELLVLYNNYTFSDYLQYIKNKRNVIINEITDTYQRQQREIILELMNKMTFLKDYIKRYRNIKIQEEKKIKFDIIKISYPDTDSNVEFNSLLDEERIKICEFFEIEFELVFSIVDTYKKLENSGLFQIRKHQNIIGFKFNVTYAVNLRDVYLILENNLTSSSYEDFEKAFSSEIIDSPLQIKWLLKNRDGNTNKRALIYFLSSTLFLDMNDKEFIEKIHFCFSDYDGKPFKYSSLKENLRQYTIALDKIATGKTYSDWKEKVDKRISMIQGLLQIGRY